MIGKFFVDVSGLVKGYYVSGSRNRSHGISTTAFVIMIFLIAGSEYILRLQRVNELNIHRKME